LRIFFFNSRLKREYILNAAIMRGTYFPPLRSPTAEMLAFTGSKP
jgi:hypothetical protein